MSEEQDDVWGYTRLSQDGRGGQSLDEQRESISDYCGERDALRLTTVLSDGVRTSGFDADRDSFVTIREKIAAGDIDGVVVRDRPVSPGISTSDSDFSS